MGRHIEKWSTGIDEFLQGLGGDPFGGALTSDGLRVPTLPTPPIPAGQNLRYLFNLCSFTIPPNCVARIRGYRQLLTIGASVPSEDSPRFVEQTVVTPNWRFSDGNVSWHIRDIKPKSVAKQGAPGPTDRQSFAFQMSDGPALLYLAATIPNAFYTNLTAYTPPNKGRPWGEIINAELGTFYSLHTPWEDSGAWRHSLDVPIIGPKTIAFMVSLRQTNPQTRVGLTPPNPFVFTEGMPPEEQFLQNFPSAIYWRIGGALIYELVHYADFDTARIACSGAANAEALR